MEKQYMQYLMWHKNKHLMFRNSINNNHSWEEQAFAEDAANPLGGFIWPPRSYTCSFCRREFRSAQALGGHMNVHRRDRARLKQSNSSSSSLSPQLEPDHQPDSGSPYSSLSSASAAILSPQNSSTTPNGSDNSNSGKFLSLWNQKFKRGHEDTVDTKLSVGLGYEIEESNNNNSSNSKKRRFMGKDIALFSSSSRNRNVFQKVVLGSKPSNSIDESIDLELKL